MEEIRSKGRTGLFVNVVSIGLAPHVEELSG
jgi:hypothetical protein